MRIWLHDLRKKKGLTMKAVSGAIGISEGYYCSIENGDKQKKMDTALILGLAKALDVEPAEILRNEAKYMEERAG